MNKKLLASLCCLSLALSSCNQDDERSIDLTLLKSHSSYTSGSLFITMDFDADGDTKTAEYRAVGVLDQSNVQPTAIALYDKRFREIKPGARGRYSDWKKIVPYITKLNREND